MRLVIVVDVPDETRGDAEEVAEYLLDPCADDPVATLVSATWERAPRRFPSGTRVELVCGSLKFNPASGFTAHALVGDPENRACRLAFDETPGIDRALGIEPPARMTWEDARERYELLSVCSSCLSALA